MPFSIVMMTDFLILVICFFGITSIFIVIMQLAGKVKEENEVLDVINVDDNDNDEEVLAARGGPRRRKTKMTKDRKKEVRRKFVEEKAAFASDQLNCEGVPSDKSDREISPVKSANELLSEDLAMMLSRKGLVVDSSNLSLEEFEVFLNQELDQHRKVRKSLLLSRRSELILISILLGLKHF